MYSLNILNRYKKFYAYRPADQKELTFTEFVFKEFESGFIPGQILNKYDLDIIVKTLVYLVLENEKERRKNEKEHLCDL